jgi:hypothetical protein
MFKTAETIPQCGTNFPAQGMFVSRDFGYQKLQTFVTDKTLIS